MLFEGLEKTKIYFSLYIYSLFTIIYSIYIVWSIFSWVVMCYNELTMIINPENF